MPGIEEAVRNFLIHWMLIFTATAGCSVSSQSQDDNNLKRTETISEPADTDTSPKKAFASSDDGSATDRDGAGRHFEGTARPVGMQAREPVLPKPDFSLPGANQMISVPAGTLLVGSPVQDTLRVNYAEQDLAPVEITPFEMDALPYPNDPSRPFLTNVTKSEAERSCAEEGKRLCTELEWEWACKSSDNRRYPSGNTYEEENYPESSLLEPASPFGVFAMGRILEWTLGSWGTESDQVERGVAKGYAEGFELSKQRGRRCAARWRRIPAGSDPAVGFRCCRGEVNKAVYTIEPVRPPFSLYTNMKPDKFAQIIQSIPELKAVHDNPRMFSDSDIRTVMARRESDRDDLADKGIHFRWKPMRWIPRQGMELWVAVGRSDRHSFIVALHEVEDNEVYTHASSLVLWDQPLPLALGYRKGHRNEMYWAPCWNCRDGGTVTFDDEKNEVIITHRW
jgi:formylglycine-generating enzyme required for sulfatase activity